MADNALDPAARRWPITHFACGDRIRIVGGKLAGVTGVVTHLSGRFDRVLAIDGWPSGVYLIVVDSALELFESERILAQ